MGTSEMIFMYVLLSIGVIVIFLMLITFAFEEQLRRVPLNVFFRSLWNKAELYKVADDSYNTFIVEGDKKIDVDLHYDCKSRIRDLVKRNPNYDVYVKAKVDHRTFICTKVYGYTLKPKEEAE